MAAANPPHAIILDSKTKVEDVKKSIAVLCKEKVLAVDAEGVHLGKDGWLTLLQIGTVQGDAYLFDVMKDGRQNKSFFGDTGLKTVLESNTVVKVIHSCSGDSAALYHQFGIHLQNVFDTQVAHLVLEESNGRRIPERIKLEDMCKLYCSQTMVYEGKEEVTLKMSKQDGTFWARRPLTPEMIEYACGDANAVIPVYLKQKESLKNHASLKKIFRSLVAEEVNLEIDSGMREERKSREDAAVEGVLEEMRKKYDSSTDFQDITDPDEIQALRFMRYKEDKKGTTEVLKKLKLGWIKSTLNSLEMSVNDENTFNPGPGIDGLLRYFEHSTDEWIKEKASGLRPKVQQILLNDISRMYDVGTSLDMLSTRDLNTLNSMYPQSENNQRYPQVALALFWKLKENKFEDMKKQYQGMACSNIQEPVLKEIRHFAKAQNIPERVQTSAEQLLKMLGKPTELLENIAGKYSTKTNIDRLSRKEKDALRKLKPSSSADTEYDPVVLALCWKIKLSDLNAHLMCLQEHAEQFRMTNPEYRQLKFFCASPKVPKDVQTAAKNLIGEMDKKFGYGKLPPGCKE